MQPKNEPDPQPDIPGDKPNGDKNDCEIVCFLRIQREFAERIESRLKVIGLKVRIVNLNTPREGVKFVIFLRPGFLLPKISLHIFLQGSYPQIHHNIPLEEVIEKITQRFKQRGGNNTIAQVPLPHGRPDPRPPAGALPALPALPAARVQVPGRAITPVPIVRPGIRPAARAIPQVQAVRPGPLPVPGAVPRVTVVRPDPIIDHGPAIER